MDANENENTELKELMVITNNILLIISFLIAFMMIKTNIPKYKVLKDKESVEFLFSFVITLPILFEKDTEKYDKNTEKIIILPSEFILHFVAILIFKTFFYSFSDRKESKLAVGSPPF